jgi:hypothetical protein
LIAARKDGSQFFHAEGALMVQLDLFDARPKARRTDPVTSHEAAEFAEASGTIGHQQEIVEALVRKHPGNTSAELAWSEDAKGLDRYAIARRLPELERLGLVRKGEARICSESGRRAVTWEVVQ